MPGAVHITLELSLGNSYPRKSAADLKYVYIYTDTFTTHACTYAYMHGYTHKYTHTQNTEFLYGHPKIRLFEGSTITLEFSDLPALFP